MPDERPADIATDQLPYIHYAADAALEDAEAVADFLDDLRAQVAEVRRQRAAGATGGAFVATGMTIITPPLGSPEAAAWLRGDDGDSDEEHQS